MVDGLLNIRGGSRGIACLLVAVALTSAVAGCAQTSAPLLQQAAYERSLGRTSQLGVGDKVRINVFGENDLTGVYSVTADGRIEFPLIGAVRAEGLSLNAFRQQLTARLANGYLSNPKVTVEIESYRPIFVHGEVRNGGEYPYRIGTRLKDAIAVAGGFNYRADESRVLLTREGGIGQVWVTVDDNIVIMPGDNIRVVERFF
jgi:polysaccharide export outer membrane protein